MSTKLAKHSTTISLLLLLVMLTTAYIYPTSIWVFRIILLVSFIVLSFTVFEKHKEAYLQNKFSRAVFVHNTIIEIISVLLILLLAGCLGWYIVKYITDYMNQSFTKFFAGIAIGLITGTIVGILIKRITDYLVKPSSNYQVLYSAEKESSWTN